ncbi:UNVERIFIED_CONTAM: Transposable element Tcb2 transposase [Trichonephila clavipes]
MVLSIHRDLLHRGLRARVLLYRIPLTANHQRLRLQWAHEHKAWQADWHQAVFSDELRFNLWDHDGRILVRRYAGEHCLPECQDNAHPAVAKTVQGFCSAQHIRLLPWSVYSPDMSPIPHVWYLVGRRLVRDLRPAASKDEFLMRMQAIWDSLPQANIQNLFDSMLRRIAALTAALSGNTKY